MIKPLENLDDIRDVAQTVLRKADVADRLPTPVDDIIASCGLLESDDYVLSESKIAQAPRELRSILRAAGRKIRGALDRRVLPVAMDEDVGVIGGDDGWAMRTAPLGVVSGAVVGSVTGSSAW